MHQVLINAGKCEGEINCTTQMEVNKLSENCARGEVDHELMREIETPGLPCRVRPTTEIRRGTTLREREK